MCLYTNEKPQIAEEPIVVMKHLEQNSWFKRAILNQAITPYRFFTIRFNRKLHAVDKLHRFKLYKIWTYTLFKIAEGFHSYVYNASDVMQPFRHLFCYPAVIPKGSEYCVGSLRDIVSTDLIIFRNKRQLKRYLRRHKNK